MDFDPPIADHRSQSSLKGVPICLNDGEQVSTCSLVFPNHRELHQRGDELTWWQQLNVDPMPPALLLWQKTQSNRSAPQKKDAEF